MKSVLDKYQKEIEESRKQAKKGQLISQEKVFKKLGLISLMILKIGHRKEVYK